MSEAATYNKESVMDQLPSVRGRLRANVAMSDLTWFRVGGCADVFFVPADTDDLADFLKNVPDSVPITTVGVGSNLLVRDGGIRGIVIRLASGFNDVTVEGNTRVRAGAAVLDVAVAKRAAQASLAGLEFMRGIPGSVGGALRMNAGAYEREIKDVLVEAMAIDRAGNRHVLGLDRMGFSYRHSAVPADVIFVEALFQGEPGDQEEIKRRMRQVTEVREASQPVRSRTGGSTFKNPDPERSGGQKAWQLIDQAGCRGLIEGGAQVSEQHCNFLINQGEASAADLENLGEKVRSEVEKRSGIKLEWEIRRIGQPLSGEGDRSCLNRLPK